MDPFDPFPDSPAASAASVILGLVTLSVAIGTIAMGIGNAAENAAEGTSEIDSMFRYLGMFMTVGGAFGYINYGWAATVAFAGVTAAGGGADVFKAIFGRDATVCDRLAGLFVLVVGMLVGAWVGALTSLMYKDFAGAGAKLAAGEYFLLALFNLFQAGIGFVGSYLTITNMAKPFAMRVRDCNSFTYM